VNRTIHGIRISEGEMKGNKNSEFDGTKHYSDSCSYLPSPVTVVVFLDLCPIRKYNLFFQIPVIHAIMGVNSQYTTVYCVAKS
jgi:hypothetical protein